MIPVPFEKFWERLPGLSKEYLVETVDNLLDEQTHNYLKINSHELLESLPEKDWRADKPNLLPLIDPLLHCFVSGVTAKQFPKECKFEMPCVKKCLVDKDYSEKYQLLPTEFFVDATTKKVVTRSYINNLDPRNYGKLYKSLESVVEAALPHFEKVLSDLVHLDENYKKSSVTLSGRPLQIIVGMKSIYLTPNSESTSKHEGSKWHIESLKNERVVASGIYYYDVSNITESRLAFRVQTDNSDMLTDRGHAVAQSNRLVVFPNVYEHSVRPFELANKSQSGYRKFITLFLVDPATKIISTADVAPQQTAWYPITGERSNGLLPLPGTSYSTSETMTLAQAKRYRNDASAERGVPMTKKEDTSRKRSREEEERVSIFSKYGSMRGD